MMMTSAPSGSELARAFELLHPTIQKWVWDRGWRELRDIQAASIATILSSNNDLVISAATAAGKTEAAFLPVLSAIGPDPTDGFRVLYVGPLKALINDQFSRLEDLCEKMQIPVVKWHGDAPQGPKNRARSRPRGVMLITPESIEAMFVRRPGDINGMFGSLDFIVVDELHSFLAGERGVHLASLLRRLCDRTNRRPRRIGLSATLGDIALAARWLNPENPDKVSIIKSESSGSDLKLQLRAVVEPATPGLPKNDFQRDRRLLSGTGLDQVSEHLFATLRGKGNHLIFAGSRRRVEEIAVRLRDRCEQAGVPNEFFAHHGNLARDEREKLEQRLKEGKLPTSAVATTTLELGIDIGSVESVAQIGAPVSIAGLRQRLGRSGRRAGTASVMRLYVVEPEVVAKSDPLDGLRTETVQAVAAVRLLLARWIEPPSTRALHFSTLLHQVLSVIAERGGTEPAALYRTLGGPGPFAAVSKPLFADLLRVMAAESTDLIEQAPDGTLMLGAAGERLVNGYEFYAVFTTPEEYRLVTGNTTLGMISIENAFGPDDYLVFSGRRWRVVSVDDRAKTIQVVPAPAGRVPKFEGSEGAPIHDRLVEEMRRVYHDTVVPEFLDLQASALLSEGRAAFSDFNLASRSVLAIDGKICIFPWRGSLAVTTLRLAFKRYGVESTQFLLGLVVDASRADDLRDCLQRLAAGPSPDPIDLAQDVRTLSKEKFDSFLSDDLLRTAFAHDAVAVSDIPAICEGLLADAALGSL